MSTLAKAEQVPEWTVGDRLRKARELRGLDQGPFAALIGVSRGTVSNYERGFVERYKPIVMNAWAAHTGISLEWLESGGTGSSPSPTPPATPNPALERLAERKRSRTKGSGDTPTTRRYFAPATAAA